MTFSFYVATELSVIFIYLFIQVLYLAIELNDADIVRKIKCNVSCLFKE